MKKQKNEQISEEHLAKACTHSLSISTKHSIEISNYIRYKTTNFAKKFLEEVIKIKKPVPFKRFKGDIGHKPGMASGRYPQKAAKEFVRLIKTVEANAQFKGLNTSNLKIIRILANRAATPVTGGRQRTSTKRTHLEIEVMETKEKKKVAKKKKGNVEVKKEKAEIKETPIKKPEEKKKVIENIKEEKTEEPETKQKPTKEKVEEENKEPQTQKKTVEQEEKEQKEEQGEQK